MKLAANVLATLVLLALLLFVGAQSPATIYGPKHQLHRTVRECARCHEPWAPVDNGRCASGVCHRELRADARPRTSRQQFHRVVADRPCRGCHPEHKGAKSRARFHHGLVPARVSARCQECHLLPAKVRSGARHPPDRPDGCVACHSSDDDWRKVVAPREL